MRCIDERKMDLSLKIKKKVYKLMEIGESGIYLNRENKKKCKEKIIKKKTNKRFNLTLFNV